MSAIPIRRRVVKVKADRGSAQKPRRRYGSGFLVGGRRVLTAAHVVEGTVSVTVQGVDRISLEADLSTALIGDPRGLDLTLMEVPDAEDLPNVPIAVVDRDVVTGGVVEGCWSIGYPSFQEVKRGESRWLRETVQVGGFIPPLSGLEERLLSLQVTNTPRDLPETVSLAESEWSGMSGAAVFAGEFLVGVVAEHARRRGVSDITVMPLDRIGEPELGPSDPAPWWSLLGVKDPWALPRLPKPALRPEPAYRAAVRAIRGRTVLVGRERELAEIAAFATGAGEAFGRPIGAGDYLRLVATPWAGKTALLAEAVLSAAPEVDVVAYFLVARESRADRDHFLAAVLPQLAWLLDKDPPDRLELDEFSSLWNSAAERAKALGRHLLLVVDGLDEDLRPEVSVADALPSTSLGARARVLVSSRTPTVPLRVEAKHPLRTSVTVTLADSQKATEVKTLAQQELDLLLAADSVSAAGTMLAYEVLGLLTAAVGGLSVEDLAAMIPDASKPTVRTFVTRYASRSLQQASDGAGYQFAHQTLLDTCRAHPDVGDKAYCERIHAWADIWHGRDWPASREDDTSTPRYLLGSYPKMLAGAPQAPIPRQADTRRLGAITTDVNWVDAAVTRIGVDAVLSALQTAAGLIPTNAAIASMLRLLELQAHHLRPPRPVNRPGYAATQLAWEALSSGMHEVGRAAADRLRTYPAPQLVPIWTNNRTARHLVGLIGRHNGSAEAVSALADGRVVSGGRDGTVRLWDPAARGGRGRELGKHALVRPVAALPNGWVVSAGGDGVVRLWDPAAPDDRGRELGRHKGRVHALSIMPDGQVISGGDDGVVRLWNPATPDDPGRELGHHHHVISVLVALPNGRVVSGARDGTVCVWNPAAPDNRKLRRHFGWVTALAALADGRFVSAGIDGAVWVGSPSTAGNSAWQLLGRHASGVNAVAVLEDGQVVSAGVDRVVRLWNPATANDPGRELGRHEFAVNAVAVLPDGRVVSAGDEGAVRLWDPGTPVGQDRELGRHQFSLTGLVVLPSGGVVSAGRDGALWLWDPAARGDLVRESGDEFGVHNVVALTDGRVVCDRRDGALRLWDPATPDDPLRELGRHEFSPRLAATSDGRVVSGGNDGAVRLWDPATPGDPVRELGRHEFDITAVAALEDGRVVSAGRDGAVRLWDPAAPEDEGRLLDSHIGLVNALAALPDGRLVSAGEDGTIRLCDPAALDDSGRELGRQESGVSALAALPDGRVVSGERNGRLRLWDPAAPGDTGRDIGHHERFVAALASLRDGRLVSVGGDGALRLWDPAAPDEQSRELGRGNGWVTSVSILPDGRLIAATGGSLTTFELTATHGGESSPSSG